MALGARNKNASLNRPKPAPTKLDKLKEIIKQQYVKPSTPSPEPKKP